MSAASCLSTPRAGGELVPVCCHCRRTRTRDGRWEERFVADSDRVTHGICRDCFLEFYPDIPLPEEESAAA